jgi:hypothetical protein
MMKSVDIAAAATAADVDTHQVMSTVMKAMNNRRSAAKDLALAARAVHNDWLR